MKVLALWPSCTDVHTLMEQHVWVGGHPVPTCAHADIEYASMHDIHKMSIPDAHFVASMHTGTHAGGWAGVLGTR
jgi:hypothetical protein